jgi:tetratricopeptide (TPR) repeat protein
MQCRSLIVGCFIMVITGGAGVADVMNDCLNDHRPDVRIPACTEIIADPHVTAENKAVGYISRGNARIDAAALQPAIADFTEAIRLKKDSAPAFAGRGRANLLAGQLVGAIADYKEAIRLSPTSAEPYVELGHAYIVDRNMDAAISVLTQAIALTPTSWGAFNERGIANYKKGELLQALDDFNKAIAIQPFSPELHANRGDVNEALARSKDAIDDFRQALFWDPSLVSARDALKRLGAEEAITAETDQRVRQGAALAEKYCSACHAVGNIGASPNKDAPEFRNINQGNGLYFLREPITQSVFAKHEKMPQFNLPFSEIDTVVAYINSISPAFSPYPSSNRSGR